ncbi:hypothetical protein CLAIMM_08736 [Cladophialophora immunda]|nr:hypothetical protein CLAIMM_08736 [Cladophialophora immunda]
MAAYVWNADATFRITDAFRGGVICIGRAAKKYSARCAWKIDDKSPPDAAAARELLRVMSAKPPDAVTSAKIQKLAGHCLCNIHKGQMDQAIRDLRSYLAVAVQAYEQYENANRQHKAFRDRLLEPLDLEDGEQSDETVVGRVRSLAGYQDQEMKWDTCSANQQTPYLGDAVDEIKSTHGAQTPARRDAQ